MADLPSDIAFTDSVKAIQTDNGSRETYARMEAGPGWQTTVTPDLSRFLSELDMFYLATATADGQPYVQYRGGSPGFLKVLDDKTLGFADFHGNQQFITTGNLAENDRAFIFLMDYVNRRRIKIWGRARVIDDDPQLLAKLTDSDYDGRPARVVAFDVAAWDVNCPQHIHQRVPLAKVRPVIEKLEAQIAELREQLTQAKR